MSPVNELPEAVTQRFLITKNSDNEVSRRCPLLGVKRTSQIRPVNVRFWHKADIVRLEV
jgi:hypothetical protein